MVENKAQEWFNEKYKNKEEKDKLHLLAIDNRDLEDELIIEGFDNLERIECFGNKLTTLSIKNCPKLIKLDCHQNDLTGLEIVNCPNVSYFNTSCNLLKNLDFLNNLDPKKLVYLSIHTNNLQQINNGAEPSDLNLEVFSQFTNLEELYLDNYDKDRFDKDNVYNRFSGSLKPLKNLKSLRLLNISGTDINSGLEHLSRSVKKIGCDDNKLGRKCSEIRTELEEAAKDENVTEELKKFEEGDTKWTEELYRIDPWWEAQELVEGKIKSAQEWLNEKYPQWERKNKRFLWIHAQNLRGSLDLTGFENLEQLYCYNNRLTELKLSNLKNLAEVHAWSNKISKFDVDGCLNIKKLNVNNNLLTKLDFIENLSDLEFLDISDNSFYEGSENDENSLNLSHFSSLENLKELYIGNCYNLGKEIYNRFEGSLESLKDLEKLEYLSIDNTDISDGLEHLPESLEEINCSSEKEGAKCKEIKQKLIKYSIPGRRHSYDFQAWMRNSEKSKKSLERFFSHQIKLTKELKKVEEIDKKIKEEKQLGSQSKWFGYAGSGLSTIGSGVSGVLASTDFVSVGNILNVAIPAISGMGGISSAYGTHLANRYAENEKVYEEELNNALAKLGIDIWNKFLRDREELKEKKPSVIEFINNLFESDENKKKEIEKLFEDFLTASEGLPKSISPEEKQKMKKELQEELVQNLWENYWAKDDYNLRKKLESFLNKIAVKFTSSSKEIVKAKLINILEELENIKEEHQGEWVWKVHENSVKKAINSINKILKHLQEEKEDSTDSDDKKIEKIAEEEFDEVKSIINEINDDIRAEDNHSIKIDSYFDKKDKFEDEQKAKANTQLIAQIEKTS